MKNWIKRLFTQLCAYLAKAIVNEQRRQSDEAAWFTKNRSEFNRARAIVRMTNPHRIDDFNYIKQVVEGKN